MDVEAVNEIGAGSGTASARFRVARGAAWLDRVWPGWAGKVDLARLDLADCGRCVLGQLVTALQLPTVDPDRAYSYAVSDWFRSTAAEQRVLTRLGRDAPLTPSEAEALGFELGDADGDYAELGDAWRAEIVARRSPEFLDRSQRTG